METLTEPVSQPSASDGADNITLEGLGELLKQNRESAQSDSAEAQSDQAEADAPDTEIEDLPEGNEPDGPEELPETEETDDSEAQDADDEEDSTGLGDKAQESVNKRIAKLTAKRKLAEEQRQDAEQQLVKAQEQNQKLQDQINKQGTEQLKAVDPLADVFTKNDLKQKIEENREYRMWALRNPDGGEMKFADGSTKVYDSDEVENILKYAEDNLSDHIPARQKWIEQNKQMSAVARQQFPAWKDTSSDVYGEYQDILQQMPEIKRFPHYEVLAGIFHMGLGAYNKQFHSDQSASKPKSQKVKPTSEPTKVASPVSAPPPAGASKASATIADAQKLVEESNGSADAVMKLINARRNAA